MQTVSYFYFVHPVYTKVVLLDIMCQLVVWLKPYTYYAKLQRSISFPQHTRDNNNIRSETSDDDTPTPTGRHRPLRWFIFFDFPKDNAHSHPFTGRKKKLSHARRSVYEVTVSKAGTPQLSRQNRHCLYITAVRVCVRIRVCVIVKTPKHTQTHRPPGY